MKLTMIIDQEESIGRKLSLNTLDFDGNESEEMQLVVMQHDSESFIDLTREEAQLLRDKISEWLAEENETDLQICTSCEKHFDIETMSSDSDSNWFCQPCYTELAPVMKAEYEELVKNGEIDPEE